MVDTFIPDNLGDNEKGALQNGNDNYIQSRLKTISNVKPEDHTDQTIAFLFGGTSYLQNQAVEHFNGTSPMPDGIGAIMELVANALLQIREVINENPDVLGTLGDQKDSMVADVFDNERQVQAAENQAAPAAPATPAAPTDPAVTGSLPTAAADPAQPDTPMTVDPGLQAAADAAAAAAPAEPAPQAPVMPPGGLDGIGEDLPPSDTTPPTPNPHPDAVEPPTAPQAPVMPPGGLDGIGEDLPPSDTTPPTPNPHPDAVEPPTAPQAPVMPPGGLDGIGEDLPPSDTTPPTPNPHPDAVEPPTAPQAPVMPPGGLDGIGEDLPPAQPAAPAEPAPQAPVMPPGGLDGIGEDLPPAQPEAPQTPEGGVPPLTGPDEWVTPPVPETPQTPEGGVPPLTGPDEWVTPPVPEAPQTPEGGVPPLTGPDEWVTPPVPEAPQTPEGGVPPLTGPDEWVTPPVPETPQTPEEETPPTEPDVAPIHDWQELLDGEGGQQTEHKNAADQNYSDKMLLQDVIDYVREQTGDPNAYKTLEDRLNSGDTFVQTQDSVIATNLIAMGLASVSSDGTPPTNAEYTEIVKQALDHLEKTEDAVVVDRAGLADDVKHSTDAQENAAKSDLANSMTMSGASTRP